MSNLYVSDLDGTLLRSNEATSAYTNEVINSLVDKGMVFSYATARSFVTAKKVTKGIEARIPLIVYNGAFIIDNITEEILMANYFDDSVLAVLDELFENKVFPIVYAFVDGKNDIDMFQMADESYAVANAHEDLKKHATGIIGSNDEDGVAKWLEKRFEK